MIHVSIPRAINQQMREMKIERRKGLFWGEREITVPKETEEPTQGKDKKQSKRQASPMRSPNHI